MGDGNDSIWLQLTDHTWRWESTSVVREKRVSECVSSQRSSCALTQTGWLHSSKWLLIREGEAEKQEEDYCWFFKVAAESGEELIWLRSERSVLLFSLPLFSILLVGREYSARWEFGENTAVLCLPVCYRTCDLSVRFYVSSRQMRHKRFFSPLASLVLCVLAVVEEGAT